MWYLLVASCVALRPVVLVPGFVDSHVQASYHDQTQLPWYCARSGEEEMMFLDVMKFRPPYHNCIFEVLKVRYDYETDEFVDQVNVTGGVVDFGGVNGLDKLVTLPFGIEVVDIYGEYVKQLLGRGYTPHVDLLGAPYDWRYGTLQKDAFWQKFKKLVETAVETNGQKAVIICHSLGGNVMRDFLFEHVDKEWRMKYVEKIAWLAPAWAGFGQAITYTWLGGIPAVPWLKIESMKRIIRSFPGFSTLLPHFVFFGNQTVMRGPAGEVCTARDVPDLFIKYGVWEGEYVKLVEKSIPTLTKMPIEPDIESLIYYNSGIQTLNGINVTRVDEYPEEQGINYVEGDGYVPAVASKWACDKWKENKNITCVNLELDDENFNHPQILANPVAVKHVLGWVFDGKIGDLYTE